MAGNRRRIKEGDIFAIPLDEQMVAVGIVLHVSKYFANAILAGYFDRCFSSVEHIPVQDLAAQFVFTPNYTGKQLLTKDHWPVIGHRNDLIDQAIIPELVVVTDVFYKDEVLKRLPSLEAAKQYEPVEGQGKGYVENRLRRYFRSNKD